MQVLLAGASGFLGTALAERLAGDGHDLRRLVRSEPAGPEQFRWDPATGMLPAQALDGVDAVVNLAGAPIAHWPWTSSYRQTLVDSRISTTSTIATALAGSDRSVTWVNASAVGYYGKDRGDEALTETSARGEGFLADLVERWESAAADARGAGRVAVIRSGVVLDRDGGALQLMRRPFSLGVGGRLGDGHQYFPSISLDDWVSAVCHVLEHDQLSGPVNLVAPEPATNADLTRLLGEQLHRPTLMRVPGFALKAVLGDLAWELLGSLKVVPDRLSATGFMFAHPDLGSQLAAALR